MKNINTIPTMVVGSLPEIVTTSSPRRVNENNLNNEFVKQYIKTLGELLKVKKDNLSDIKMVYIGGYTNQDGDVVTNENTNTAKLYFSALKYYFRQLGYGELQKSNFVILDSKFIRENAIDAKDILENSDFVFLGIGQDRVFGELLESMISKGINLKDIILRNNILVTSACAGSVVSASKIYGGQYDSFYYNRPDFVYPDNYDGLGINPVTMEPNFGASNKEESKTLEFKETCLLPDSNRIAFYLCSPNSMFITNEFKVYACGEISLLIDGEEYKITGNLEKADITELNTYLNIYNVNRSGTIKLVILDILKRIKKVNIEIVSDIINDFSNDEQKCRISDNIKRNNLKLLLNTQLLNLFNGDVTYSKLDPNKMNADFINSLNLNSDSEDELYLKFYLVSIIKSSSVMYKDNISKFLSIVLECMTQLVNINPKIVYYFICCFSSFYSNKDMKKLLALTKIEETRRIQELNTNNLYRKLAS
jgi:hypothetical protein